MKADAILADRRQVVRTAFRAWGTEAETLAKIVELHPDDRVRVGFFFRLLLFFFTCLAISTALGFFSLIAGTSDIGGAILCLVFAVPCALATEWMVDVKRRCQGGIEQATAWSSVTLAGTAFGILYIRWVDVTTWSEIRVILTIGAVMAMAAGWRWGMGVLALAGMALLIFVVATLPNGRWALAVVASGLAPLGLRWADAASVPPCRRFVAEGSAILTLVAGYFSLNLASVDRRLFEELFEDQGAWPVPRALAIAATALLPPLFLAVGIVRRQRSLIWFGALIATASLITLRLYVHVAPLWVILGGAGTALFVLAVLLRRLLASGPEGERGGFTARKLEQDPRFLAAGQMAVAVIHSTPEARDPSAPEPGFAGGGGRSGGAGASGSY